VNKVSIAFLQFWQQWELELKAVFRSVIFLSLAILGGCSWLTREGAFFDETEYDYTRAEIAPKLEIPEGVGEPDTQDHYLVPELDDDIEGVVYGVDQDIMSPMQVLTLGNKVRLNRTKEGASAFVIANEIVLWDLVERFFEENQVPIKSKDVAKGEIITGWQVREDDAFWSGLITAWRNRFKVIISDAPRPNENTLTVEILQAQEFVDEQDEWRDLREPGRNETQLLNSILGFMYVEDISKSRKKVSQSGLGGINVTLGTDSKGNAALITSANYDHVWSRISVTLALLKIVIDDHDRTQGLVFLDLSEHEQGFFEYMAFWSDDDEGDRLELPGTRYVIQVSQMGNKISMTFLDEDNQPIGADLLAENFPVLENAFKARGFN